MRVAVLNYCGTVGKTTVAAHLLAPRIPDAKFYAVETINETAGDLGLDVDKLKGERYGKMFRELMRNDAAIVDVGASNIEDFIAEMIKFVDSHSEFDFFIVPVISGTKEQKETLKTIDALVSAGVPAEKIRVVFNRVDTSVAEEFPSVLGYASKTKSFIANPKTAIHENEVFSLLGAKKLTISAVLSDQTDYRAELRALGKDGDSKKAAHYADMHAIKSLAKGVNRELDAVYDELFK